MKRNVSWIELSEEAWARLAQQERDYFRREAYLSWAIVLAFAGLLVWAVYVW